MFKKLLFLFSFVSLLIPGTLLAQSGSISGTVTDSKTGEALPGVNVRVLELTKGGASNIDGEYTITALPSGTYTVVATFTGFKQFRRTVEVGTSNVTLDIALEEDILGLDELVITGYGTVSKREITGSISKVSAKDFADVPFQNTESILQGRAAGVLVNTTSGNPGGQFSVIVRGIGSLNAGNQPLYIVDGVQISFANQSTQDSSSPLNAIDPANIESIEVLKDGASASIYGANGANGVVLITTKRGSDRGGARAQISAKAETGYRAETKRFDMLETPEWLEIHFEAANNQYAPNNFFGTGSGEGVFRAFFMPAYGGENGAYTGAETIEEIANTRWQDISLREGSHKKYSVAASGGDERTRYYLSGGYEETEGHVLDSRFERFNLLANSDQQLNERLSTSVNINLSSAEQNGICQDGSFINCPVTAASFEPPITTPLLANGDYNARTRFGQQNNLLVQKENVRRTNNVVQILSNATATYRLNSWLTARTLFGMDFRDVKDNQFRAPIAQQANNGTVFAGDRRTANWNTNTVLNGRKTFDEKHTVSGLLGFEYRRERSEIFTASGASLPTADFTTLNATAEATGVSGFSSEYRQAGFFTSVNYDFDGKYILKASARVDGSSRFGADNRYGFFPSVSGLWRVTEEDFFDVPAISDLALRLGYGTTGNSSIGNFASRGLYGLSGSYNGTSGLSFTQLPNTVLTWESQEEINFGVDLSLYAGRISANMDVYTRDNNDLLLSRPLPNDTGFGSFTDNVGAVRNQGVEMQLNTVNVDRGGFTWLSSFTFAVQKNEVISLNEGQDQLGSGSRPVAVGRNIGAFWVPRWAGVNPANGDPMWYDADGNITYQPTVDDRIFYDGTEDDVIGGLGNTLSYKGLTFDVFFQYALGGNAFMTQEHYFLRVPIFFSGLESKILDRWQQPGDVTDVQAMYSTRTTRPGTNIADPRTTIDTKGIEKTDYIRLKNITLSYNLPVSLLENTGLRGVRLYATGLNLMTWTAYSGLDPEQTSQSFPTALQVNGGIEVQF